jgi:cell wall-associated NlpC family hydrolase
MNLSKEISDHVIRIALNYVGRDFDFAAFNCVHFVREVYAQAGIVLPPLVRYDFPPREFHLSEEEFLLMPVGRCVFFKRKNSRLDRQWTHVAIIVSEDALIHCTRNIGEGVTLTSKSDFLDVYSLTPIQA